MGYKYLQEQCILTPRNDDADDLNYQMLSLNVGQPQVSPSVDTLTTIENSDKIDKLNKSIGLCTETQM